jgi:C-terminal processing protease CtpA/Prc
LNVAAKHKHTLWRHAEPTAYFRKRVPEEVYRRLYFSIISLTAALSMLSPTGQLSSASVIPYAVIKTPTTDSISLSSRAKASSRAERRLEKIYRDVWRLVKDNYHNRQSLHDWASWEHKYDGRLHSREQLVQALESMLDSLDDGYSYILSDVNLKERKSLRNARRVVQSQLIEPDIGYLRLQNFYSAHCEEEFKAALKRLSSADGLVLDLRNNHGGYIEKAQRLFELLADHGLFMSYQGSENGAAETLEMRLTPVGWDILQNGDHTVEPRHRNAAGQRPLIVLVNKDTRSAAELLSGALRENQRALIVGTKTFGKGVLQDVFDVGQGIQLKLATARYFLPNGENIHDKGLSPDISIANSGQVDSQLDRAVQEMRRTIASRTGTDPTIALSKSESRPNM